MKKILEFCERYAPELLVLLVCLPALYKLQNINSYHTFFYFTDFSTGFGTRKLLGSVCDLWFPETVRLRHILPLIYSVNIAMIGLFAWLCGKWVRSAKEYSYGILTLLFVYLLSPYSFVGYIRGAVIDFYNCTATICFLCLYMKYRGTWYYYLLTVIILCVACLTHQVFCNFFFPLIFALFLYDIFTDEQNRKKNIFLYSIISLGLLGLFCAITFLGTMNVDYETFYSYLQTRSGSGQIDLSRREALYYNYYANIQEYFNAYIIPSWKYDIARFTLTLIIFAPLWGMLWTPWIMAFKNAATKKEKWCFLLIQLSLHAIILPAYVIVADYERITYAYCFCQICLLMVLYYWRDNVITGQVNRLFEYAKQYKGLTLALVAYICGYELVKSWTAAPLVDFICNKYLRLGMSLNEVIPQF